MTPTWRNEMSIAGGPWSLVEEYHLTPVPERYEIRSDPQPSP
jgi:hypothetical protein